MITMRKLQNWGIYILMIIWNFKCDFDHNFSWKSGLWFISRHAQSLVTLAIGKMVVHLAKIILAFFAKWLNHFFMIIWELLFLLINKVLQSKDYFCLYFILPFSKPPFQYKDWKSIAVVISLFIEKKKI